jgi:hypothetical protein
LKEKQMKEDLDSSIQFQNRTLVDKPLYALLDIVLSIGMDRKIKPAEKELFNAWLNENEALCYKQPYSILIPLVKHCIENNIIGEELNNFTLS